MALSGNATDSTDSGHLMNSHASPSNNMNSSDDERQQATESSHSSGRVPGAHMMNAMDSSDDEILSLRRVKRVMVNNLSATTPKRVQQDRLSSLPDSMLLHILTILPIEEAIRTSCLSKRWDHLWASMPSLCFVLNDEIPDDDDLRKFIAFVDRALLLCISGDIQRFSVAFSYTEDERDKVDSWMRFAVSHRVKELELPLILTEDNVDYIRYHLPRFLYSDEAMERLNLTYCMLGSLGIKEVNWKALRNLSLYCCCLSTTFLKILFTGCPALRYLELDRCCGINRLDVIAVGVEKLVINLSRSCECVSDDIISISAPYLRSLTVTGILRDQCRVQDLSSLVEAEFDFVYESLDEEDPEYPEHGVLLVEILRRLRHVNKLMLGRYFIQVLSLKATKPMPCVLSCKSLVLHAMFAKWELSGLLYVLQSCRVLESLTITVEYTWMTPSIMVLRGRCDSIVTNIFSSLKTVKIFGLGRDAENVQPVLRFLQFLLEHAKVLEELSITPGTHASKNLLFEVAQQLLKFPRSSPCAKVQLNRK